MSAMAYQQMVFQPTMDQMAHPQVVHQPVGQVQYEAISPLTEGEADEELENEDTDTRLEELRARAAEHGKNVRISRTKEIGQTRMSNPNYGAGDELSLWCDMETVGRELGTGTVYFFTYTRFLVQLMLVYGVMLLPSMCYNWYAGFTDHGRHRIREWNDAWTEECNRCTGDNKGNLGFVGRPDPEYGTYCKEWDISNYCANYNGTGPKTGRWCCEKWCYVSDDCLPAKRSWTRQDTGGPLYFAYKGCRDNATLVENCPWTSAREVQGNGSRDYEMIGAWVGALGNLGVSNEETAVHGSRVLYVTISLMTFVTMGLLLRFRRDQAKLYDTVEEKEAVPDPSDFALFIQRLPYDATEKEISDFVKKHVAPDNKPVEVVKTIVIYDCRPFAEQLKKLQKLTKELELANVKVKDEGYMGSGCAVKIASMIQKSEDQLEDEIHQTKEDIVAIIEDEDGDQMHGTGKAVVVLRSRSDAQACVKRWSSTVRAIDPSGKLQFCCQAFACGHHRDLPTFKFEEDGEEKEYHLDISKAPNPGDLNWEAAGRSGFRNTVTYFFLLLVVWGLLAASLYSIQYLLVWQLASRKEAKAKEEVNEDGNIKLTVNKLAVYVPAAIIAIINSVLVNLICNVLGPMVYRVTLTAQKIFIAQFLTISLVFNTVASQIIVLRSCVHWYRLGGLVHTLALLTVTNGFQGLSTLVLDTPLIGKRLMARFLVDPGFIAMGDEAYMKLYEPSEPELELWYGYVNVQFFLCVICIPFFPLAAFVGALWLHIYYWLAKVRLLRLCKRPDVRITEQLDKEMQDSLQWVLLAVPLIGAMSLAEMKVRQEALVIMIVCAAFALVFMLAPKTGIFKLLGLSSKLQGVVVRSLETNVNKDDYYEVQKLWRKGGSYHKSYILQAVLPEDKNPELLVPPKKKVYAVGSQYFESQEVEEKEEVDLVEELRVNVEHVIHRGLNF